MGWFGGDSMWIKSIDWVDESAKEADVIVTDGNNSIICFSCPCNYCNGDTINEPLECLDVENIILADGSYNIERKRNYEHIVCGKMKDITNGIVEIGEIILHINNEKIPKDINNNDMIKFCISRVDLY